MIMRILSAAATLFFLISCAGSDTITSQTIIGQLVSTSPSVSALLDSKLQSGFDSACSVQGVNSSGDIASGTVSDDGSFSVVVSPGSWLFGFLDCSENFIAVLVFNESSVLTITDGSGTVSLGETTLTGGIARVQSVSVSGVSGSTSADSDYDGIPDSYECSASDEGWGDISFTCESGWESSTTSSGECSSNAVVYDATFGIASMYLLDPLGTIGYGIDSDNVPLASVSSEFGIEFLGSSFASNCSFGAEAPSIQIVPTSVTNSSVALVDADGESVTMTFSVPVVNDAAPYIIATPAGGTIEECTTYTLTIYGGDSGVYASVYGVFAVLTDDSSTPIDDFTITFTTGSSDDSSCD